MRGSSNVSSIKPRSRRIRTHTRHAASLRPLSWLRWLLPPALLAVLAWRLDLSATLEVLKQAQPVWLLLALLVVQLQVVLSAMRWRFTAVRLQVVLPLPRAIAEYYLATLLNQTLPGGVGGDAVRAWRHAGEAASTARAVRAVVLERLAGQVAFFVLAGLGLVAWPLLARDAARPAGVAVTLLLAAVLVVVSALVVWGLARRGPVRVRRALQGLGPDVARAWWRHGAWLTQSVLSVSIVGSYVAVFALCARTLGDALPALAWLTVLPLTLATMLIPISVGGWGVREAAAAALWPLVGLSAEHGVASSVLYGLVNVVGALPGLWPLVRRRTQVSVP